MTNVDDQSVWWNQLLTSALFTLLSGIATLNYLMKRLPWNKRQQWNLLSKFISVHPRISVHPGNFFRS